MENRKYVVNRDDIYVGEVVQTSTIYRYKRHEKYTDASNKIGAASAYGCRSMLFVPNSNVFAEDLLYNSPNYPILNMTNDDICLNLDVNAIVVREPLCLAPLLEYFGYAEQLGYEDIVKVRKQFFDGTFARENAELFGYKPVMAKDLYFYKHGEVIEDARKLRKLRMKYEWDHRGDRRKFRYSEDGPLPRYYFDELDKFGDISLLPALLWHERTDSFVPDKKEGKIKKLSKF